jgi:hypothetical protein
MDEPFFFDLMWAVAHQITEECEKPGPQREALERAFSAVGRDICIDNERLIVNRRCREDVTDTDPVSFYVFRWSFLFGNFLACQYGMKFNQAITKDELN